MKGKGLIMYLMGLSSLFITVQVDSYNFRNTSRSMNSVEYQRYKKPDNRANFDQKQGTKDTHNSRVKSLESSIQRNESSLDNRGLMPHEKNRMRGALDFYQSDLKKRDRVPSYQTTDTVNSNELVQKTDDRWRYQGSAADGIGQISKRFHQKTRRESSYSMRIISKFYKNT